jgi:phosphoribosylglycinamide formyltransferase-1
MGYYGERVHKAALDYGVKLSGATVHFVDEGTDTGPIIMQESVPVMQDDDPASLAKRVLTAEHRILPAAVKLLCEGRLAVDGRRVRILPANE